MPFDGLRNVGLTERLSWAGIVPVSEDVLEAHKIAEVEKHPGDWLYRHRDTMMTAFVFFPLGGAVVSVLLVGVLLCFVSLMTVIWVETKQVKAPARWRERPYSGQTVPDAIWALAKAAKREIPSSHLVIGELIQDTVMLDPYLILTTACGERVCLGIWDGETIIAMGSQ